MAKDGTNRGGRRVRAGDKPTPLADKITAGKAAKVLEVPELQPDTALAGAQRVPPRASERRKAPGRGCPVPRNLALAEGTRL